MKHILKPLMIAAALLVVAVPTASASTGLGWVVEGKRLHTGESKALAETPTLNELPTIVWGGAEVQCTEMKLKGAQLLGSGEAEYARAEVQHLLLSGCVEEQNSSGCEVKPIETVPLKLLLESEGGVRVKVVPKEGETLGTMVIARRNHLACGVAGSWTLKGSLTASLPGAGSETATQQFTFQTHNLTVGVVGGSFQAGAKVGLESKQAWAIN